MISAENMKILVAYFSPTGTTAKVAEMIADEVKGDLFEIRPDKPYSKADLKWTNPLARCNKEKFLKKDVACSGKIEHFSAYSAVFIGFPIWYYQEPNIIDTFVKSYDWTGKDVFLFATSGGSDIKKVSASLQPLMKGEIVSAKLLNRTEDLAAWLDTLAL